jgi:hypothetical protein
MLISAELRWFWLGNCPSEVEQWFRSGEPPGGGDEAKPRVDRYFHHKGIVELGIKVRDERKNLPPDVEVKGLVTTRKAQGLELPADRVEIWCKWKAPPLTSPLVFTTEKVRWMRKFDADSAPSEIPLGPDEKPRFPRELPVIGCNVELTRVRVRGRPEEWWSLCFEAFGDLDSAPDALVKVIRTMQPIPTIDGAFLSYPAWLDTL